MAIPFQTAIQLGAIGAQFARTRFDAHQSRSYRLNFCKGVIEVKAALGRRRRIHNNGATG
jgi:hypothetical protein